MFQVLLNRFTYVESHKLLDGRLLISTIAVGFSLFALVYDYFYPFSQSRYIMIILGSFIFNSCLNNFHRVIDYFNFWFKFNHISVLTYIWLFISFIFIFRLVLMICVISYFLIMGVLTWYTSFMEQGIFCTVLDKDAVGLDPDNAWNASSSLKRYWLSMSSTVK